MREDQSKGLPPNIPSTVRPRIIGPCARTPEFPLLVRPGVFFFCLSRGQIFSAFAPFLWAKFRTIILAHGPIVRVFTVVVIVAESPYIALDIR